jgi:hypothetical protein
MKYILMMNAPKPGFATYRAWSSDDVRAHSAILHQIGDELRQSGELVLTEGLSWPENARLVRTGPNGTPITDGVFPESKEFLAGFWIVDVGSEQRAVEIALRISGAPGPGGVSTGMPMEVRAIMSNRAPEVEN